MTKPTGVYFCDDCNLIADVQGKPISNLAEVQFSPHLPRHLIARLGTEKYDTYLDYPEVCLDGLHVWMRIGSTQTKKEK